MERQPVSRKESIINAVMWRNIIGQAIYQVGMIMVLLFWGRYWFNLPYDEGTPFYADLDFVDANPTYELYEATNKCFMYTIVFQSFVFMQLFNMLNARLLGAHDINVFRGIFGNWIFIFILVLTFSV